MTAIAAALAHVQAHPAPVIFIDTCSFLDLFRRDPPRFQPRVRVSEIQTASELLQLVVARPDAAHLVVPELVPREYLDHADRIEQEFDGWIRFHDENQEWLDEAAIWVAVALPPPSMVQPFGLHARFRTLANELLARAIVLDRDQACLDRAVHRLISKQRPSHRKEMKDSMNIEQCLELARLLQRAGFSRSRVFISSNTNDFAEAPTSSQLHLDLQADFAAAGLGYYTSLRSAIGRLRANGEIP